MAVRFEHDMNCRDPYTAGNFLNNGGAVSFSRKFLLLGFIQVHVNVMLVFFLRLIVHPSVMIVFFLTNLMHKFFILIHLLHSSTCFEHYYARLQEDNRLREDSRSLVTCVLNSRPKRVTIPDAVLIQLSS